MDYRGPSQDKGKGVNLCNWGGAELLEEDLDTDIQCQILRDCYDCLKEVELMDMRLIEAGNLSMDESKFKEEEACPTHKKLHDRILLKRKLEKEISQ